MTWIRWLLALIAAGAVAGGLAAIFWMGELAITGAL